ncbi:organic hydroperoxide resistance protein [Isosphaeraceae bacterium EP7]
MSVLYTTSVEAVAGREGRATSDDKHLDVTLSTPKSMGGAGGDGTNPEQLFGAGYAACFGSALMLVARQRKINPGTVTITAEVTLNKYEDGFALSVALKGTLPDVSREQAQELMEAAHEVCPYSRATHGNIGVSLSVA